MPTEDDDRTAAAEARKAPDADLAAERRAILERLSRREIAADDAAAACVSLAAGAERRGHLLPHPDD